MKKKKPTQVVISEPYVFAMGYNGVGMTLTHYFKLEGFGPTLEGVIATDVQREIFIDELGALALTDEGNKFYFATGAGQNIVISGKDGEITAEDDKVLSVAEFLIDSKESTPEELQTLRENFIRE